MVSSPPPRRVVLRISDESVRETVRDLAELAGAEVAARPWEADLGDPGTVVVLGDPPSHALLGELDACAIERAAIVTRGPVDRRPGEPRWFRLPADTAALLRYLGSAHAAAALAHVYGLHGGAGASRFAAALARAAERDGLRVVLVDADPWGAAAALLDGPDAGAGWGAVAPDDDVVPLRLAGRLPRWRGVRVLTGPAPPPPVVWRTARALRFAADLVVLDGCPPPCAPDQRPDLEIAVGVASERTVRAWRRLRADPDRLLVVRTPGVLTVDETVAACGAVRHVHLRPERNPEQDQRFGVGPADNIRTATTVLTRRLWSQWTRP